MSTTEIIQMLKEASSKLMKGLKIQQQVQDAMRNLLGDHQQFHIFLNQSKQDVNLFICLMKFVKESLIDKSYLGGDPRFRSFQKKIIQILQQLIPIPALTPINKDIVNVYISSFGSLLGLFLRYEGDGMQMQNVLNCVWENIEGNMETKIYIVGKIIQSSLQQLSKMRNSQISLLQISRSIKYFMSNQSEPICEIVTNLLNLFGGQFNSICVRNKQICQNILSILLTAKQNYFNLLGRDEYFLDEIKQKRIQFNNYFMEWELTYMKPWLQIQFFFLNNISATFDPDLMNSHHIVETLVCRIIGTIRHMYDFLVPLGRKNFTSQLQSIQKYDAYGDQIEDTIIAQLLLPYLRKISFVLNQPCHKVMQNPLDIINFINDRAEVYILKILLHHKRVIGKVVLMTQQLSMTHPHKNVSNNLIIYDYCTYVLRSYRPNYENYTECPQLLAFKLFCLSRDQELMDCNQASEALLDEYKAKHRFLFIEYVIKSIVIPYSEGNRQSSNDKSLQEEDGNNWYEIMKAIDYYFLQLAFYAPHFFDDGEDSDSSDSSAFDEMQSVQVYDNLFNQHEQISFAAERQTNSSKYGISDYCLFKQLIETASNMLHVKRIQSVTSLIHFFSCIKSLLITGPQIQARNKLFMDMYKYSLQVSAGIPNHTRYQRQLVTIYIINTLIQQCFPETFVSYGSQAALTTTYFLDNGLHSIDNLIKQFITRVTNSFSLQSNPQNLHTTKIANNTDIYLYAFDVFTYLAQKLSKRAQYLQCNNEKEKFDIQVQECQQMINNMFDCLLQYSPSDSPECASRLYRIQGLLVNQFQISSLYEVMQHLKERSLMTLRNDEQKAKNERRMYSFLAGLAGVMSQLTKPILMRTWVEISLIQLEYLLGNEFLQVNFNSYEYLKKLAKQLSEHRIYMVVHDNLAHRVYNIFKEIIPMFVDEYLQCPMQHHDIDELYTNFALLPVYDQPLLPLPHTNNDWKDRIFPSTLLLNQYFDNIHRVDEVQEFYGFTFLKVDYFIRYLQEIIQKDYQMGQEQLQQNLKHWKTIFCHQKFDHKVRIACLANILTPSMPVAKIMTELGVDKSMAHVISEKDNIEY